MSYPTLLVVGGLSSLGFEPLNLGIITLLAVAFLAYSTVHASRALDVLLRGWLFGLGHFGVGLNWIATAFTYQSRMPTWLGPIAVILLSAYLALFPALSCYVSWYVGRRSKPGFILVFAAAWLAGEWLRATLLTGFAWNPLGAIWLALPWIAQGARWVGAYGMSGVAVVASGILWAGLQRYPRIAAGFAGGILLCSFLPDSAIRQRGYDASELPILIVQPNIGQDEKYDPADSHKQVEIYLGLSERARSRPHVLLWPEAATLRFLDLEPDARSELAATLAPSELLLTGGESLQFGAADNDVYRNSVFALDSKAALHWRYDKAHLVPFGEYLPVRRVLEQIGLSRLVPGAGDFTAGPGPQTLPLPGFTFAGMPATVGIQLCYEITFSGHVIDRLQRPSFVFNPSNDAWFGSWGPPQHLAQARLRAIEEGISVVRATSNGISAVIDPSGRLVTTIAPHQRGVIDTFVPNSHTPTLFSRLGLWASGLFGILLGIAGVTYERFVRAC